MGTQPKPFDFNEVHSKLSDHYMTLYNDFLHLEEAAKQIQFRYEVQALADTKNGAKANFHFPEEPRGHFENLLHLISNSLGNDEDEVTVVPISVAIYALAGLVALDAKLRDTETAPLRWFTEGDAEAIDLSTLTGRAYLLEHYMRAMRGEGSVEEFEAFVAYCQSDEEGEGGA